MYPSNYKPEFKDVSLPWPSEYDVEQIVAFCQKNCEIIKGEYPVHEKMPKGYIVIFTKNWMSSERRLYLGDQKWAIIDAAD